jgi:hypothetical protein
LISAGQAKNRGAHRRDFRTGQQISGFTWTRYDAALAHRENDSAEQIDFAGMEYCHEIRVTPDLGRTAYLINALKFNQWIMVQPGQEFRGSQSIRIVV